MPTKPISQSSHHSITPIYQADISPPQIPLHLWEARSLTDLLAHIEAKTGYRSEALCLTTMRFCAFSQNLYTQQNKEEF